MFLYFCGYISDTLVQKNCHSQKETFYATYLVDKISFAYTWDDLTTPPKFGSKTMHNLSELEGVAEAASSRISKSSVLNSLSMFEGEVRWQEERSSQFPWITYFFQSSKVSLWWGWLVNEPLPLLPEKCRCIKWPRVFITLQKCPKLEADRLFVIDRP